MSRYILASIVIVAVCVSLAAAKGKGGGKGPGGKGPGGKGPGGKGPGGKGPGGKRPPLPDLCDAKKLDYLTDEEASCTCNCTASCPTKDDIMACKELIKETCGRPKEAMQKTLFDMAKCVSGVVSDCEALPDKDFSECSTCIDSCITEATLATMEKRRQCREDCAESVCTSKPPSSECKSCKDECLKIVTEETGPAPPAPPPSTE